MALQVLWILAAAITGDLRAQSLQTIVPRRQLALVIGNAAYSPSLKNPVHDAEAVAQQLKVLGFEDVLLIRNAPRKTMGQAIDEFVNKLQSGDVALFYYAGHAVQVDGENYLVPVDYQGKSEADIPYDTFPVSGIEGKMERGGSRLNIIVLDACRDNPYRTINRSTVRGLASMSSGRGTFIAFATAPGLTASDNTTGNNGLFTQYLLEALAIRCLSLNDVFDLVRQRVEAASSGAQLPWSHSSILGKYTFWPDCEPGVTRPKSVTPVLRTGPAPIAISSKVNPRDGQRYVWVPAGTFRMGCSGQTVNCEAKEKPQHLVTISKGFWMGRTEVTVQAFQKFGRPTGIQYEAMYPVTGVTWKEASDYCRWIGGRLPTEAEWELAARGGSEDSLFDDIQRVAWYADNSAGKPHEVAQMEGNSFGLFDMLGNVYEWVADWYEERYEPTAATDPLGPASGIGNRVSRGGSWATIESRITVSHRLQHDPESRDKLVGFRCVVSPWPE